MRPTLTSRAPTLLLCDAVTDDVELAAMHADALGELDDLLTFDTSVSGPRGRRMLLGLFDGDDVRSIAAAEVSHAGGLAVSSLVVYPAELNNEDSVASLRMIHALHLLADAIETPLDLSRLEGRLGLAPSLLGEMDDE